MIEYPPPARIVQACKKLHDGSLSRTVSADHCNRLAAFDGETDLVQNAPQPVRVHFPEPGNQIIGQTQPCLEKTAAPPGESS